MSEKELNLGPKLRKDSRSVWWLDWTKDSRAACYDIVTPAGVHVQAGKAATSSKLGKLAEPFPMPQIASAIPVDYQSPPSPFEPGPVPPDPEPPAADFGADLPARLALSAGTVRRPAANSGAATDAVNASQPGDIVELASGDYGYINIDTKAATAAAPITIRPQAGATITIRRVDIQESSFIRFTGQGGHIYVTDPTEEYDLNLRIFASKNIEVSFCELGMCSQPIYAGDKRGNSDIHILGNYIHNAGKDANHEHGMYVGYGQNPRWVVAGNIVTLTRARGIQFYSDVTGDGFSDGFVVNNTITKAGLGDDGKNDGGETYGYGLNANIGWTNMIVANNISAHNQRIGYVQDKTPSGGRFANNLGWDNPEGSFDWKGPQEGNIEADPKLDANYSPQAGSRASGTGLPALCPPYVCMGAKRAVANIGAM